MVDDFNIVMADRQPLSTNWIAPFRPIRHAVPIYPLI